MKFIRTPTLIVFIFTLSVLAFSQPGQLDSSFGVGGIARGHFPRKSYDQGWSSALQPDGKIVVVGTCKSNSEDWVEEPFNLILTRFNTDGTRDMSFGVSGIASKALLEGVNSVTVVALQADGKIVVGATSYVWQSLGAFRSFRLIRFATDGSVDSSFGVSGVVTTTFPPNVHGLMTSMIIGPDGKIVTAGYSLLNTSAQSMIAIRYKSDGSIDETFNGGSPLFVNVTSAGSRANFVDLQPDGKIVLGGNVRIDQFSSPTNFAVVRLNVDGTLDNTFDGDGKVVTSVNATPSTVTGLKVQSDGKIVAAGYTTSTNDVAVARYNTDGSPDTSFDSDGIVTTNVAVDLVNGLRIQSDGKLVVFGRSSAGGPFQFLSVRYTTSGGLDSSYSGTGIVTTQVGAEGLSNATSALLDTNGKIVLTGYVDTFLNADLALARYNSDGSLDSSFDGDGKVTTELGNTSERGYKIAFQPDGKIVVAGDGYSDGFLDITISRFNANGTIDQSFGTGGFVAYHFPEASSWASAVKIQTDGKIVIAANLMETQRYNVLRFNSNGDLDLSFGTGGVASVQVGTFDIVYDLELLPDGKIVAAGSSSSQTSSNSLIRLNSDGTLDTTFGTMGKVLVPDSDVSNVIHDITVSSDGKIYAAAGSDSLTSTGNAQFTVIRLTSQGVPDTTFGSGGIVHTPFTSQGNAWSIELQGDGKAVVAGMGWQAVVLARYLSNGALDMSFDADGKVITQLEPGYFHILRQIAIQQNGKIVGVGNLPVSDRFPDTDAAVFRYNSDGSPDSSFGVGGKLVTSLSDMPDWFSSILITPSGKLVAAGASSNGRNYDFTLARFTGDAVLNHKPFDFDGDGKSEVGIFRPSVAEWWIYMSGSNSVFAAQFGASTDKIAPADYTGDGKTDLAFWRPATGEWFVVRSEDNTYFTAPFGTSGDIPVPADYDADGKADVAVFRPSTGFWFVNRSAGGTTTQLFGSNGDQPIANDYDGDGRADLAIYRPSVGQWWINRTTAGTIAYGFGDSTDKLVPGDYTGDGKADVAFWRPATGEWFILRSEDSSYFSAPFGTSGDIPSPGDFDGDGKFDVTVFRPSSATWFVNRSSGGTTAQQFGATGDRPIETAFLP